MFDLVCVSVCMLERTMNFLISQTHQRCYDTRKNNHISIVHLNYINKWIVWLHRIAVQRNIEPLARLGYTHPRIEMCSGCVFTTQSVSFVCL